MISMLLSGGIMRRIDARILVVIGFLLTALVAVADDRFTPQMDDWPIISSGVIQGLGLGMVFVPLSTVAFATLDARFAPRPPRCSAWCAISARLSACRWLRR